MKICFEGIFPALLTPFTKGGRDVDYDQACGLATWLADRGVHGLFVAGTTGEGPLMSVAERKRLLEGVVKAVGKRIKVIAHTGCFDTASTIELTRHAAETGAVGAGVVAPGFFAYDDEALFRHYKSVADSVKGFPVLLYNIPGCARNELSIPLVLRLAQSVENIVGMKDSGGNLAQMGLLLGRRPANFSVISGVDECSMQALASGANGCVSSTANVVPELFLSIFTNVRKGDLSKAWKSQVTLGETCALFGYGRMIARYKEGVRLRGFDAGFVRPPQRELTTAEKKTLVAGMRAAGFI